MTISAGSNCFDFQSLFFSIHPKDSKVETSFQNQFIIQLKNLIYVIVYKEL